MSRHRPGFWLIIAAAYLLGTLAVCCIAYFATRHVGVTNNYIVNDCGCFRVSEPWF